MHSTSSLIPSSTDPRPDVCLCDEEHLEVRARTELDLPDDAYITIGVDGDLDIELREVWR